MCIRDRIAPFDFAILKQKSELQKERKTALSEAYLFFRVDPDKKEFAKSEFLARLDREGGNKVTTCLLYTSPSPRDRTRSRMPSSA